MKYTQTDTYFVTSMQKVGQLLELIGKTPEGQYVKFQAPVAEAQRFRIHSEVSVTITVNG